METVNSSTWSTDPEVEVSSKAKRRVFTAKYKAKILREADACAGKRGAVGALLRREGLYSSHLTSWRKEVEAGFESKKRGPKPRVDARDRQIAQLERQVQRVTQRAERAEALAEVQKKLVQLWGETMPSPADEDS